MTQSPVVDFFALEASEYLERMDALLAATAGERAPAIEPFVQHARSLRGAATMARQAPLAELAASIEVVALGLRDGSIGWTSATSEAVTSALDGFKRLLRQARTWTEPDTATAAAHSTELRDLVTVTSSVVRPGTIVPIARLFHDDAGPHILERNPHPPITADLRFRQAAVPLASTLRRLIADARHPTDVGARRAAGEDLSAGLRDLGELAESYDIRPVVNFARARAKPLGELDERALDVVDGAAQALIESAGTAWARPTPSTPSAAIEAAAPAPRQTPNSSHASVAEATPASTAPQASTAPISNGHAPASGQALVALLETSISGLHQFGADDELAPATLPPVPRSTDGTVPIESLVYRGRAALDRARQVRDMLRQAPVPEPALLSELFDLLDLAAIEEPAPA